jgi:5-methyltetrahydrofolate--homocysteine methyltransferase
MGTLAPTISELLPQLAEAIVWGRAGEACALIRTLVANGADASQITAQGLVAPMSVVGRKFREFEFFVPEVLIASRAMNQAFDELRVLVPHCQIPMLGKVVIGTVKGDLHDIGKNLVLQRLIN